MHVLLIEPDVVLARVYMQSFVRLQHRVTHVRGAQQAISAADADLPDVVVLEMQLAAHSGSAFLYEFRTYHDWLHVPIILHTLIPPDTLRVYEKSLNELGVAACLYKPQTSLRQLVSVTTQHAAVM
jgi:DNA-binding response OmpR family regulator